MANFISFNADEALDAATRLDSFAAEIERINSETAQIVQLDSWKGAAQEAYLGQLSELKPHMDNYVNFMVRMAEQLRSTANAYAEQDQGMAGQYGVR